MAIYDEEWDKAQKANEPELYFKCERKDGSFCIKMYKPSVGRLVEKRTGMKLTVIDTLLCQDRGTDGD